MSPEPAPCRVPLPSFPRVSGDEPTPAALNRERELFSPRERG